MKTRSNKTNPGLFRGRSGFTLIEVIATIVVSAILVALTLPLISSGLEGSRRALLRMPATYTLRTEMDDWWQLYRTVYPIDLVGLAAAITTADPPSHSLAWVDFDAFGVEFTTDPAVNNVLRFTLANSQGERLTTYFSPIP
ncbi:MAG: prepilin-type N-terminal cleavage/methylation domain-containing protein [Candidatus Pelagisphaera sp.]|jgi:prepilin-type N-terminal cleavage/methylation domain-containing protein